MEDPFAPEDVGWFRILRQQTTAAIAMGELFVNRNEWLPLVSERLIDFIRIHQSAAGGLNQCRKIAACCEFFNVRTAWHGPGNVDPIGHAYNLHLDLATYNFGIQEQTVFPAPAQEVFPGIPRSRADTCIATARGWESILMSRRRRSSRTRRRARVLNRFGGCDRAPCCKPLLDPNRREP